MLLPGFLDAYAGVKVEAPPPGPFANTLEDDATSSPSTAAHDRILIIGSPLIARLIGSVPAFPIIPSKNLILS